jgi:arylsulfatase A-like enzyme/outer membrane protein assembly factor BamB
MLSSCRPLLVTFSWVWLTSYPLVANGDSRETNRPPNVVIMLADDAGWGDFSSSGNKQVSTPHIDSIAKSGVKLDRFYVCSVCSPTRAELLTGRYHVRCGVAGVSEGAERLNLDEKTIADSFQASGYATGLFGKWHNGSQWPYHPRARGFGEFFGYSEGHWGEYFNPPLEDNDGVFHSMSGYIVDVCTDKAIDFVRRNQKRPFLCYIPFTTPHSPWSVPQDDWKRFASKDLAQRGRDPSKEDLDQTRCVLAMMENQDRNVGRVLGEFESLGLRDNTIVVYFSDNGPQTGRWNDNMKGQKGAVDEGSIRSVCYIQWPAAIKPQRTLHTISSVTDLLPTLVSLAGIPHVGEKPLDGLDLSPWLKHDKEPESLSQRLIVSRWAKNQSVRSNRYRMDSNENLFDMVADPSQSQPIPQESAEHKQVREQLSKGLKEWRELIASGESAAKARPFSVGFPAFPITQLPARDGVGYGQIKRSTSAPNSSYFVNWSKPDDRIIWDIEVETAGVYDIFVDYTCPLKDVGSQIELQFRDSKLVTTLSESWDPPLFDNQDTILRPKAESQMKPFRRWNMGQVTLPKGRGELQLRALNIPGNSVMDLRRLTLSLQVNAPKSVKPIGVRVEPTQPEVVSISDGWSKWRGAKGDAHVEGLPKQWSDPEELWRVPLPANGVGGVAAAHDLVVASSRDANDREDIFAFFDATGVELFRLNYASKLELDYGNSPRATPVILDDIVLCLGAGGQLHAVDVESGDVRWKTHFVDDLGGRMPAWGYSSSPMVIGDEVIVQPGGLESAWVGLDLETGKPKWKSTGRQGAYASPLALRKGDLLELIGCDDKSTGAWNGKTGERLWEIRPRNDRDFNVPSPVLVDDKLFLVSENNGARLYQLPDMGQKLDKQPTLLAETEDLAHDSNSPVRVGKWIAGVHEGLIVLDPAKSLKLHARFDDPLLNSYCSLIVEENRILMTCYGGVAILVEVTESGIKELGRHTFEEPNEDILAHAAFDKGVYYVRGPSWLAAYQWK